MSKSTSLERLARLSEIRAKLPFSERTMLNWAATGAIPARKIGGLWYAIPQEVHAAINAMAVIPTPAKAGK